MEIIAVVAVGVCGCRVVDRVAIGTASTMRLNTSPLRRKSWGGYMLRSSYWCCAIGCISTELTGMD